MTFFRSIVLLTAVCLCISFAYALGHALSTHDMEPVIIGVAALLLGSGMLALLARRDRRRQV